MRTLDILHWDAFNFLNKGQLAVVLPQEVASVFCSKKDLPGGGWKGADEETSNLVAGQGISMKQVRE